MPHATRTQLKARLNITGSTADSILDDALDWAQKWIDGYTGRTFEATTATRYYTRDDIDPDNAARLIVDEDLLAVTGLVNGDGTGLVTGSCWLEPRNGTPKRSIL